MYDAAGQRQEFAYFYSDWIWPTESIDWMKSLLLFFDGCAISLPNELAMRMIDNDPTLAGALYEQDLLKNFQPGDWLDEVSATHLCRTLERYITTIGWRAYREPLTISSSHWGRDLVPQMAKTLTEMMLERGIVTRGGHHEDLVLMRPQVRHLILTLYALALSNQVAIKSQHAISVEPVTDNYSVLSDFVDPQRSATCPIDYDYWPHDYLDTSPPIFKMSVISRDISWAMAKLKIGSFDLSAVPLDELLDFKAQQGAHYRAYARSVRDFVQKLNTDGGETNRLKLLERFDEIGDQADDLSRRTRIAFGRKASAATLSFAGATWSLATGNPLGEHCRHLQPLLV